MSPEPVTPTTPLDVPATPTGAAFPESTANTSIALQRPSQTPAGAPRTVCLAEITTKDYARFYLSQVYGLSSVNVRYVDSPRALVASILSSLPVDRLILLLHSAGDQLMVGAAGEVVPLEELQLSLAKAAGKVGSILFDGCTLGTMPVSLYTFAQALAIKEATAWTHTHVLGRLWKTLEPPQATSLNPTARQELEWMAPWLPLGESGASESAAVLERELLKEKGFVRAYELFFAGLTEVNFKALLAANAFDPMRHFPRAAMRQESCISRARAVALEEQLSILGPPTRLVVRANAWD